MKCAIIGHGKMGREIERILIERGHSVEFIIDEANAEELTADNIKRVDVAFEFTTPDTAPQNLKRVLEAGGRVVCGTTGWLQRMGEMESLAKEKGGALFYASNFSIGVNMMFRLNRRMAELMNPYEQYDVRIEETHHIWKKDAPSGTAITLAEGIIEKKCINERIDRGELVECPIPEFTIKRYFYLCYNSNQPITSQMRDFLNLLYAQPGTINRFDSL